MKLLPFLQEKVIFLGWPLWKIQLSIFQSSMRSIGWEFYNAWDESKTCAGQRKQKKHPSSLGPPPFLCAHRSLLVTECIAWFAYRLRHCTLLHSSLYSFKWCINYMTFSNTMAPCLMTSQRNGTIIKQMYYSWWHDLLRRIATSSTVVATATPRNM